MNSFLIYTFAGVKYKINGVFSKMSSLSLELISDAYTIVTIDERKKYIFKINQTFLDRDASQTEALIQLHQMRTFYVIVDDCEKNHLGPSNKPGGQCLTVDDTQYGMHIDGWKCYFRIQKPTEQDLIIYNIIELSSYRAYEPQCTPGSWQISQ